MIDQATRLRVLMAEARQEVRRKASRFQALVVAGGKDGVGTTTVALNLGLALSARGHPVSLVDANRGARSVDTLSGSPANPRGLVEVVLIDAGAGMSANLVRFISLAGGAVVVTTPEPAAITTTYALIKGTSREQSDLSFWVVVNQAASAGEGERVGMALVALAHRALRVRMEYAGAVPVDPLVARAARTRVPLWQAAPTSPAAVALRHLAPRLLDDGTAGDVGTHCQRSRGPRP